MLPSAVSWQSFLIYCYDLMGPFPTLRKSTQQLQTQSLGLPCQIASAAPRNAKATAALAGTYSPKAKLHEQRIRTKASFPMSAALPFPSRYKTAELHILLLRRARPANESGQAPPGGGNLASPRLSEQLLTVFRSGEADLA